jgi:uncharacterized protein (DUF885 family)
MPSLPRWIALPAALLALAFVASAARSASTAADAKFEALGARFVDEFGRYAPVNATGLGDHRFDGELDDLSEAGRAAGRDWAKALLAELATVDRAALSRANQVDAAMLENQLRFAVWSVETYRD